MKLDGVTLQEENTYLEFVRWADSYEEDRLEEFKIKIPEVIRRQITFVKKLARDSGFKFSSLLKFFKEKVIFQFFTKIKFSFVELHKILKKGFKAYQGVLDAVSEFIAQSGIGKFTAEKLKELDKFLLKHPKVRRLAGIGVAALLVYIWFNMTFTGDPQFDFDMSDLLAALAGNFSLANLFSGTQGTKLLLLFATGAIGLTFPWPGPARIQFAIGIIQTLAQKVRVRLQRGKEPIPADI